MAWFDTDSTALQLGAPAPDFELPDQDGHLVRLADYRGRRWVVVYFYPQDNTYGCTRESCAFRDAYEDFTDAGAEVLGISSDSSASHRSFADKHRLPFKLLCDEGGKVRGAYGVPNTLLLFPGRMTFVIDKEGVLRHRFNSQLAFERHVAEALETLKAL